MGAFSGNLVKAAVFACLRVSTMVIPGAVLARQGLFEKESRRAVSSVAFYIFFPAYFFIELLPSVSPSIFRNWWPLLFAPAFAVSLGIAFGHLICLILRLPRDVRGIVLAATSLANMTAMVPVLVQSLAEDSNSPLRGLEPLARAYVAFALLFVSVSHFTFGPWLLRPTRDSDEPHAVLQENVSATGCGDRRSDTVWSDAAGASDARCSLERGVGRQESSVQEALPEREFHTGAGGGGRRQGARDRRQGDATSSKRGFWRALWRGAVGAVRSEEKDRLPLVTVPTLCALLAVPIGMALPIKRALVVELGEMAERVPVLDAVGKGLSALGKAAIPCAWVVLGGSLQAGPPKGTRLPVRACVGILVAKLVCVPAIGTAVVWGMVKAGAFSVPDPAFLFVILSMFPVPTSSTLQVFATILRNGSEELAVSMFWQYVACLGTLPAWMALALYVSERASKGVL